MSTPHRHADPIEEHIARLSAALRGPTRPKARMIQEMHDGLADTVAAHQGDGLPYHRAAHQAVREFGGIDELVSGCQRELTIAQARQTAGTIAFTVPLLIVCWHLLWSTRNHAGSTPLPTPALLDGLGSALLAAVGVTAALAAGATLAATGTLARWWPVPYRLPLVVAWTGTTTGAIMPIATLALVLTTASHIGWPQLALAGVVTVASHAVLAASSRACRRCAQLPTRRA